MVGTMSSAPLLGEVFTIKEVVAAEDFVLKLHSGISQADQTVADYVVTPSLARTFDESLAYAGDGLRQGKDVGVFIHGSFGAGKSHFMAILDLLLRGDVHARALPGLQQVVASRGEVLDRNLLTVDYHLIGASSLEAALFGGFVDRMRQLHPGSAPPMLHRSDHLFSDAALLRDADEDGFFAKLNAGTSGSGWGSFATGWTAETYDDAVTAPTDDPERQRLAAELAANVFRSATMAGEWLDIDTGLKVMTDHAHSLGYEGVVLFLDELVLWLAANLANREFVSSEGSKVAKLVEQGAMGHRAVPLISFVARQRELADFLGESVQGAAKLAVGDTFRWWEGRFNRLELAASDLPEIASRRLLTPRDAAARQALVAAIDKVKANKRAWDVLMTDSAGSDEAAFAKVYPFSPALVDTLVALSGLMQRERTALKVMAQLLSRKRTTNRIDQIIGVGDLFDVMVLEGDQPLTPEMQRHFSLARELYARFRRVLLDSHGLTEEQAAEAGPESAFTKDDRLAKTLLVAALAPTVPALQQLTAARLAALNYGSVNAMVPGMETQTVLTKVKTWAQSIGELKVGEGPDPLISLTMSGVDYDSVLARVQGEDNAGNRRQLLRRMVFEQFGIGDASQQLYGDVVLPLVSRGVKRNVTVLFGNIRDADALPDASLRASGDGWKIVVDYPFDDHGHTPNDDVVRLQTLMAAGLVTRTVGWVPRFLTKARQDDLGELVALEHLFSGTGEQFEANAGHLPVDQRPYAREALANRRDALRASVSSAIKAAYGVVAGSPEDIDTSFGQTTILTSLDPNVSLANPVGASLRAALENVCDQLWAAQFPSAPVFEPSTTEVTRRDLSVVLDTVRAAVAAPAGRLDSLDSAKLKTLRRVANPLRVGQALEGHYVFDVQRFGWRADLLQWAQRDGVAASIPVATARGWFADLGLTRDMVSLIILAWAALDDKQFTRHGGTVRVPDLGALSDDLHMVDPRLPDEAVWETARERARVLFGLSVPTLRNAGNAARVASEVRAAAARYTAPTDQLLSVLTLHEADLRLTTVSPRMISATTGAHLVADLASQTDDTALLEHLAGADLPDEPQALAKSIASAGAVAGSLQGANWDVLTSVAGMTTDQESQDILAPLRGAAEAEELHSPLDPALKAASKAGTKLLVDRGRHEPPTVVVPPEVVPSGQATDCGAPGDRSRRRGDRRARPIGGRGAGPQDAGLPEAWQAPAGEAVVAMSGKAPTVPLSMIEQYAQSLVRKARGARVLALRAAPRYDGPPAIDAAGESVLVRACVSSLAVREAIQEAGQDRYLVVLTDRPDDDLGDSLTSLFWHQSVQPVDQWRTIPGLFSADRLSPDLRRPENAWLADALLANVPSTGYPVAGTGVVSLDHAAGSLAQVALGRPRDLWGVGALIEWSTDPAARGPLAEHACTSPRGAHPVDRRGNRTRLGPCASDRSCAERG